MITIVLSIAREIYALIYRYSMQVINYYALMYSMQVINYYAKKVVHLEANKPADDVARQINAALGK